MSKATAICVAVFFTTSLTLAYMASHRAGGGSVVKAAVKSETVKPVESKPAETTPAGNAAKDIPN
jgi:preprotein translocase subunit SecG